ncbi:MAG: M6 family metalloprotease domain-containing protein, partial [Bacteroidales bacterium]|nr:M6 family metalloprotease domain-containing protein [Bacteroidales bacterium]
MKKLLLTICCTISITTSVFPRPAKPTPIEVKQPDGTTITIILKGDERVKWAETIDGYSLLRNDKGVYEYAVADENGDMIPSGIKASNGTKTSPAQQKHLLFSKAQREAILANPNCPRAVAGINLAKAQKQSKTVNHRMPVIIVSFTDRACIFSKADFDTIFNMRGLDKPPYTGSIADYFYDNSRGTFEFTSDIFGPYTLSKNMSHYGGNDRYGNDINPQAMVREAVQLAHNDGCDFSQYDADEDDYVDGVHIIFAGEGEETTSEANAIWSHEWELFPTVTLDGKKVSIYSCSPELNAPGILSSIGAPAHEMGHALGLPDFYDTDYENSGGEAVSPGEYDLMDMGSYNNDGYTPPLHNAWSRMFLGWLERKNLTEAASVNMPPAEEATICYVVETKTEHEYFVLDNRPVSKWDAWENVYPRLGAGLLIFAVDLNNGHWDDNCLNCNPATRGFYIKQANGGNSSKSRMGTGTPFPGSTNKTAFTDSTSPNAVSKAGEATEKPITNIRIDIDNHILFDFMGGGDPEPPIPPSAIENLTANSIIVFPNPAKSLLTVKSNDIVIGMELFDFIGKRVAAAKDSELFLQN